MKRSLLLIVTLGSLISVGCQREKYPRVAVVPAEVRVLYRGKPAVGAQVVLVPVNDDSPDGIKPRGRAIDDGTVKFGTYAHSDGAPPGEYRVSIRWANQTRSKDDDGEDAPPGPPGGVQPDRLRERYSDPKTSGLKVQVEPGKPIPSIELK